MDVKEKIKQNIDSYGLLSGFGNVLVAFSGGPDSLCLLNSIFDLKEYYNINVHALHVNHMLRGTESDADELYCRNYCKNKAIEFHSKVVDVTELSRLRGKSIEETARNVRYEILQELSEEIGYCAVLVGHNRDDRAETILFNIIRGTGATGLKGMDWKKGNIIRPMLNIPRTEIEKYITDNNLVARQDSTNILDIYTRNKIRLKFIPSVSEEFRVDFTDNLIRMGDIIKDDDDCLDDVSEGIISQISETENGHLLLNRKELVKNHRALQRRIIRKAVEIVRGNLLNIGFDHVERLIEFCKNARTNAVFELPGGLSVVSLYDRVIFTNNWEDHLIKNYEYPIEFPGTYSFEGGRILIKSQLITKGELDLNLIKASGPDSPIQHFDYDKIRNKKTVIRNRRENDYIIPLNFPGTKKLKKFFSDEKIPCHERSSTILLAFEDEIIWIIGYRISENYKVDKETKTILKCEVEL